MCDEYCVIGVISAGGKCSGYSDDGDTVAGW